jgi:flap endonuclease-1
MGIKKLYKFLNNRKLIKKYNSLTKYVNNNKNNNKKSIVIAIDFWLYAHKFKYSYGNIIIGFWNQIIRLLTHRIIPLYVFDGKAPIEKQNIIQTRYNKKNKLKIKLDKIYEDIDNNNNNNIIVNNLNYAKKKLEKYILNITKNDIDNIQEFFNIIQIPYLVANGEADSLCAKLYKLDYITCCLSDDMDMLALGCGKTIKFNNKIILEFDLYYILQNLEISYEQFVEMCILFGCDYIKLPFKIDVNEIYELIKHYGSIDNILTSANHPDISHDNIKCEKFIKSYNTAKDILMKSYSDEEIQNDFNIQINNNIDPFIVFKYFKKYGLEYYINDNMDHIIDSIEYINYNISKKYI